jgi:hypothetical protein
MNTKASHFSTAQGTFAVIVKFIHLILVLKNKVSQKNFAPKRSAAVKDHRLSSLGPGRGAWVKLR